MHIKLSVHEFIDFILRCGDIDSRFFNEKTMEEGSFLHSKYQNKQGENYIKEYPLNYDFYFKDYIFTLNGRCDGVIIDKKDVTIEEIKTSNEDLNSFYKKYKKRHLGQAEIYAYMYLLANNLKNINVKLTYISQKNSETFFKLYKYNEEKISKKINKYFEKYVGFIDSFEKINKKKKDSLLNLSFPFDTYRNGQFNLINDIQSSIQNDAISLIEANTGIGKTMSFLYASLNEIKKNKISKIFYITPKNSGFYPVKKALLLLENNGLKIKSIFIYSKEKVCLNKENPLCCNPDYCIYSKNYFDNLKLNLLMILKNKNIIDYETLLNFSLNRKICPFEFCLDLTRFTDLIISDYNYFFHPLYSLKRLTSDKNESYLKTSLLIDESHNLISRSQEMYSAYINTKIISKAINILIKYKKSRSLIKKLKNIKEYIFNYFEIMDPTSEDLEIDFNLLINIKKINESLNNFKENNELFYSLYLREVSLMFLTFDKIVNFYEKDKFKLLVEKIDDEIIISLLCLDASKYIYNNLSLVDNVLFFSGTLTPFEYYENVLLNQNESTNYSYENSFDNTNLKILIDTKISLKYKDRDSTINQVILDIYNLIYSKDGNYLVYAPSYEYLKKLISKIENNKDFKKCNIFYESSKMSVKEKNNFLANFNSLDSKLNVGFCVLGGSFSEAIELEKTNLNGVVIIGVGFPKISKKNSLLENYYNNMKYPGFDYTYTFPGINKIRQTIGRIIRSENDRGIALLIDSRYKNKQYKFLFNEIYKNYCFLDDSKNIKNEVIKFYK